VIEQMMDVEVVGAGKRLFGDGEPVPDGCVGIGLGFGAAVIGGGRVETLRLVKPAHEMLAFLERLHQDVVAEMAERAKRVRSDAARGPLTADAAYRLLHEGGLPPGTLYRRGAVGDPCG
jgi:hypothetical protein